MIRSLLVLLPLLLLALLFPTDARAVCLANCPPVWDNPCNQLTGIYACSAGEECWVSSDRCCAACQSVGPTPPSCQTSDQGCGANGCPANTRRICQDCGTGWTCSCNPDSACGGSSSGGSSSSSSSSSSGGSSGGCTPTCSDSGGHCSGTNYTGNCGQTCTGTKCDNPGRPTLVAPTGGVEAESPVTFSWNAGVGGFGNCSGGGGYYQACLVSGLCANSFQTSKSVNIPPIPVGNQGWNVKATNTCGVTGQTSATRQFCAEGFDPANANYVSTWSSWSLCNGVTHARSRTRTCREDCGTDDCAAYPLAESETCYGQMTGVFFDASDMSVCPANPGLLPANLKISGGTITLSGTPNYGPYTTDATGRYTTASTLLSPGTYLLSVNPGSSTFVTAPKFSCQGTALSLGGSDPACLTQPCETAPATTHNFGFWKSYGGWWQVTGGSVFGGAGIGSNIPSTIPAGEQYLILPDSNSQDGLAQIKTGTINLGTNPTASISISGWNAASSYSGDNMDYDYFMAKTGSYPRTNLNTIVPTWNGSGKPSYTPVAGNDYQVYTYTGNVTMDWSPAAGEKVIYFINGNVVVSGDITVPTSSPTFLAVIASGSITFDTNVTNVDGWWVGSSLNFPCVDTTPLDGTCDKTDVQFVGNGSFVGWTSISLGRDQGGPNNSQPSERFVFRPDLIINAPEPMKQAKYIWRRR